MASSKFNTDSFKSALTGGGAGAQRKLASDILCSLRKKLLTELGRTRARSAQIKLGN
jgi:hypothetical protein